MGREQKVIFFWLALCAETALISAFNAGLPKFCLHPVRQLYLLVMSSQSNSARFDERLSNRGIFSFKETVVPGLNYEMQLKRVLVSTSSEFQDIDVVETCFGKVCGEYDMSDFCIQIRFHPNLSIRHSPDLSHRWLDAEHRIR